MEIEPTPAPWNLSPVGNGHRILGGPKCQVLADIYPTAKRASLPNGLRMAAALELYAFAEASDRIAQWEDAWNAAYTERFSLQYPSEVTFWNLLEKHLPEVAAKCPPLTDDELQELASDNKDSLSSDWTIASATEEHRADARSEKYRPHDGAELFDEAFTAWITGLRHVALAKARGEALPSESEAS